ncbi:MAG: DUF4114 domain-containing protein [Desulfobacterales bacterium]|nr:DUF4114 domain-containing protein [Desulfobacterales bacterium]
MKKTLITVLITMLCTFFAVLSAHALPTTVIDLGDETIEYVQLGYSGDYKKEDLGYWFSENGITNPDGSAIDPVQDQLQHELFYTDIPREYQVEFLGIGYAGYHSPFGVFSYDGNPLEAFDSSLMTYYDPLFTQNEVAANSVFDFQIKADTYFGFYLNSNNKGVLGSDGKPSSGSNKFLSTMVASNAMPTSSRVKNKDQYVSGLDHALFFETNKGYTISFEDIVGGGDADYEDLVVNFSPSDGTGFASTPEPGTNFLLGVGLIVMGTFIKRQRLKKPALSKI